MKKVLTTLGALASLVMAQQAFAADGTVNFTGSIVNAPCNVIIGDLNQTIQLGQVRTAKFTAVGAKSDPQAFGIKLENCDISGTNPLTKVTIKFDGDPVPGTGAGASELFGVGLATSAAKNVGVEIADYRTNTRIKNGVPSAVFNLAAGETTLRFISSYVSTAAAVLPGTANATAQFSLVYQ